jgi:hypothetical protein
LRLITLSDTHTHTRTHTLDRTPLGGGLARHEVLSLTKQNTRDSHAHGGIQTSKRATADSRRRRRGHRDRLPESYGGLLNIYICLSNYNFDRLIIYRSLKVFISY